MSQKTKMCKSPKSIVFPQQASDKIDYESLSTNCTIVGSNNLHLVKKPQIVTSMSPVYSNPSPVSVAGVYPTSPYSSPASLKSPSPQLQPGLKPPTPQPTTFPVMQIINHPVITARSVQAATQQQAQQNVIKLKPPLNILPKPPASPQQSPKPSVSPQIVVPSSQQTIVPTAQPLVLNQMGMLAPGVQFILRPQTQNKLSPQVQQTPQGLILQPGGQQLFQLQTSPRSQQVVRVLPNGVGLQGATYVTTQVPQPATSTIQPHPVAPQPATPPKKKTPKKVKQRLDLANIMKLSGIGDDDDVQFESDASQSESEQNNAHSQPVTPQPQQSIVSTSSTPTSVQAQITTMVQPQTSLVQAQTTLVQPQTTLVGAHTTLVPPTSLMQPLTTLSQPQTSVVQQSLVQQQKDAGAPKIGNIQLSGLPQALNAAGTPIVQVLNQAFQGASQAHTAQPAGNIALNSFINPNYALNNGLMVQRTGGYKLALGEDGRLVLQHDPTLNQDIQSQLLLQAMFGLNGFVLQPSLDQQIHSQTVQTIQQQSVQTIQQQTVQSQTIQTVHQIVQPQLQSLPGRIQSLLQQQNLAIQPQNITLQPQGIQVSQPLNITSQPISIQTSSMQTPSQIHFTQANQVFSQPSTTFSQTPITTSQPVLKVQPFQKSQPPVQTVHPTHHHVTQPQQTQPPPTSYVVNLTPEQLEQLTKNGQLTVNGQTIFMQRPNKTDEVKKASPKSKKKPKNLASKETTKSVNNLDKTISTVIKESTKKCSANEITPVQKTGLIQSLPIVPKSQPSAIIQPSVHHVPTPKIRIQPQPSQLVQQPKVHILPSIQTSQPSNSPQVSQVPPLNVATSNATSVATSSTNSTSVDSHTNNHDVEKIFGQLFDESTPQIQQQPSTAPQTSAPPAPAVVQNQNVAQVSPLNNNITPTTSSVPNIIISAPQTIPTITHPTQRVHTIQLTPQKQQQLKQIQLQIQQISAQMTNGNNKELQHTLNILFQEQQKILASGKLLPPDKVFYHNNQLIVNNTPIATLKTEPPSPVPSAPVAAVSNGVVNSNMPSSDNHLQFQKASPLMASTPPVEIKQEPSTLSAIKSEPAVPEKAQTPPPPTFPLHTKAKMIEQQANTDQNGAVKPDIATPFKDKADACKRLIRYHCFDQPVLSEKDLHKADEIFELTARHFIDKFGRMVDKYRYLLLKESQRHVQTSELMMLDRMFLADEQQSLVHLRQEIDDYNNELQNQEQQPQPQGNEEQHVQEQDVNNDHDTNHDVDENEEYDEWACIQKELGVLPMEDESSESLQSDSPTSLPQQQPQQQQQQQGVKRTSASFNSEDKRLDSLKKFRVDKVAKKEPVLNNDNSVVRTNCTVTSQHSVYNCATTSTRTITNGIEQIQCNAYNSMQRVHHHSVVQNYSCITRTMVHHHSSGTTNNSISVHSQNSYSSSNEEMDNNDSIDEQVQSAIDSILNLQQTSTSLDLDETMQDMLA